jgi:hypothetical protein
MVLIDEDPNARFEKAMFNLLRSFNFIDLNLGLSIPLLAEPRSPRDTYKRLSNMSFDQRMKWFKKLLTDGERHLSAEARGQFENWLVRADEVRELRNVYVHAIWRFNPRGRGKPVSISSPVWMEEKLGNALNQEMSLVQIEAKATLVEGVLKEFMKIRKTYNV